jgi:hypothetical protein
MPVTRLQQATHFRVLHKGGCDAGSDTAGLGKERGHGLAEFRECNEGVGRPGLQLGPGSFGIGEKAADGHGTRPRERVRQRRGVDVR